MSYRGGVVYAGNNQCVSSDDRQNHGINYGVISRDVGTISLLANGNQCGGGYTVDPGYMASSGWTYKNGQPPPCDMGPWHYNPNRSYDYYWWTYTDAWPGCNNGAGQNVVITHDIWHAVWGVNTNSWLIGSWRPATSHCHCP